MRAQVTAPVKVDGVAAIMKEDRAVGMAMVLDDAFLVTCAHVVNRALGLPESSSRQPTKTELVEFMLPLASPPDGQAKGEGKAHVAWWAAVQSVSPQSHGLEDLAILKIESIAGASTAGAALAHPAENSLHELEIFGYPDNHPAGTWAHGKYSGPVGNGWLEIINREPSGSFIQGGFSGSPVFDSRQGAVVGIAVASHRSGNVSLGYLIPTRTLEKALGNCRWRRELALRPVPPRWSSEYLTVSDDDRSIHIVVGDDQEYRLPDHVKEPSARTLGQYAKDARHWKRVHSIAEAMFQSFWRVQQTVLCCAASGRADDQVRAQHELEHCRTELQRRAAELERLPSPVARAEVVKLAAKTPNYTNLLMRWLGAPPGDIRIQYARELANRLASWMLQALHIADLVLETHFKAAAE